MSYTATSWRVKCELTRQMCLASETPPADLVIRARAKLESVKASGDISFYIVYETRLAEVWKALRATTDEGDDRKVMLTLAAGSPALTGIKIDKPTQEKAIASLTIEASREVITSWRFESFKLTVGKRLRDAGIKEPPNNAQIYGAFARVKAGEKVSQLPLTSGAPSAFPQASKAFSVVANKTRMEIGVVIRNPKELRLKPNRDAMLALLNQAVKQLSEPGIEYKLLKKDFITALQGALDGPEGLGVEVPLALLAAIGQVCSAVPLDYPGAGRISFRITPDKMEATIDGFQKSHYDDPSFSVGPDWVQAELRRFHINQLMPDDLVLSLAEAIKRRDVLDGLVVARGQIGQGGRDPYLHAVYRDAAERSAMNLDEDNLDMREMQQRATVRAGQLVAIVKYLEAAVPGLNVYGQELPPPQNDDFQVQVGEGIIQREVGRFHATSDGIPSIDMDSIALSKILVHEGDVNLRTGNIRFDGPVEIKGSIEAGAFVEATGDITVHGTVQGSHLRVGGNLEVRGGITTGAKGRVYARGNVKADFIENSHVICGGDLIVAKGVLNCSIVVGGKLKVHGKSGVLAGGTVICRHSVTTSALGFKRGAVTTLQVGVDWRWAFAAQIRKTRLERLQKRATDDRQALRELVQRKATQMTAKHNELKLELQERLGRLRTIIEKADAHQLKAQGLLTYDTEARIHVRNILAASVHVTVAGQFVAVANEVAGVVILGKRRRGSYIVPIEEIEQEEAEAGTKRAG